MDYTGERYLPDLEGQIRFEHMHRYVISLNFVKGKEVLDIASGEGYGSAILATQAKKVTGVDIDSVSVQHAIEAYHSKDNLFFKVGSADAIPLPDKCLDVVVSFETIEHHDKHEEMLSEIKRILRPDGLLIISSPNRVIYSEASNLHNPYHIKELNFEELDMLLKKYFLNINYYGQNAMGGSFVYNYRQNFDDFKVLSQPPPQGDSPAGITKEPNFFIAFCSDIAVVEEKPSVYLDPDKDLFAHVKKEANKMQISFEENYQNYQSKMKETEIYISSLSNIIKDKDQDLLIGQQEYDALSTNLKGQISSQKEVYLRQIELLTQHNQQLIAQAEDLVSQIEYFKGQLSQLKNELKTENQSLRALEKSITVRISSKIGKAVGALKGRLKNKS